MANLKDTVVVQGGIKSKKVAESEFRRQRREGGIKEWGSWLDTLVTKNALAKDMADKWREPDPVKSRG